MERAGTLGLDRRLNPALHLPHLWFGQDTGFLESLSTHVEHACCSGIPGGDAHDSLNVVLPVRKTFNIDPFVATHSFSPSLSLSCSFSTFFPTPLPHHGNFINQEESEDSFGFCQFSSSYVFYFPEFCLYLHSSLSFTSLWFSWMFLFFPLASCVESSDHWFSALLLLWSMHFYLCLSLWALFQLRPTHFDMLYFYVRSLQST